MIDKLKKTRSTFYNIICNLTGLVEKLKYENNILKNENEKLKQVLNDVTVIKK